MTLSSVVRRVLGPSQRAWTAALPLGRRVEPRLRRLASCQPCGVAERLQVGRARGLIDELRIREFLGGSYPRLVTAVAAICGSRAAAEDAVQEALARAWERSLRGEDIRNLEAWVRTGAMNLSRSATRRLLAERRAGDRLRLGGRLGGLAPEPSADRLDVLDALARLGLDVAEISAALGVREGTAKTTLHRARLALARGLGEGMSEETNDRGR
jgi:RNA polymerase sigma-70 factor (ECF subfamily)